MNWLTNSHLIEILELIAIPLISLFFGGFYVKLKKKIKEDFVEKWVFEKTKQELQDLKEFQMKEFKEISFHLNEIRKDIKDLIKERKSNDK